MDKNDVRGAAAFLRRMAPTQSHDERHNFLHAADVLETYAKVEVVYSSEATSEDVAFRFEGT